MKKITTLLFALVASISSFAAVQISVQNGNYSNPSTWLSGAVPAATDTVFIADTVTILIAENFIVHTIITDPTPNAVLIVQERASLTVTKIFNDGLIKVESGGSLVQPCNAAQNVGFSGYYEIQRTGQFSMANYNAWSSPIKAQTFDSTFIGVPMYYYYSFDAATQAFVLPAATDTVQAGSGYFVTGNAVDSTKTFRGQEINNGLIYSNIQTTTLGNNPLWTGDDWNLLGNPYPSGLSANAFWLDNSAVLTDALYFWDNGQQPYNAIGDYASWNLLGGVPSSNSATYPNGTISSGQGFFAVADAVQIGTNATAQVEYNNCQRVAVNDQFFKADRSSFTRVYLKAEGAGKRATILVGYNEQTTDAFEAGFDARNPSADTSLKFSSLFDSEELSIQGVQKILDYETDSVALVIEVDSAGNYVFAVDSVTALNHGLAILDIAEGTETDILTDSFSVNLDAGKYANRFYLVFNSLINSVDEVEEASGMLAFVSGDFINVKSEALIEEVTVYSITGQKLLKTAENGSYQIQLNKSNLASGVYVIHAIIEGKQFSTKIIL